MSRAVASGLGIDRPGRTFTADGSIAAGKRLLAAEAGLTSAAHRWAFGEGFLVERTTVLLIRVVSVCALFAAVLAAFRAFGPTMWVLPFAVLFVLCVPTWGRNYGAQRTATGRVLWSRAGGFHRMLSTDSAEARFDFSARSELYTANLPYATAAGVADRWADKYRVETGRIDPLPGWFESTNDSRTSISTLHGSARQDSSRQTGRTVASSADFERSLSRSIGAYTASLNATSTDGGGGRGSWGGGGGRRSSSGGSRSGGGRSGGGGRGGGGGGGGSW